MTHLFADGGRIIKTARTDYTEHVARADMQAFVRSLMKEQHKAMFTALRLGELDVLLESMCGPFSQPPATSKLVTAALVSAAPPSDAATAATVASFSSVPPFSASSPNLAAVTPPPEEPEAQPPSRRGNELSNPNLHKVTPSVPPPSAAAFDLDVAALDRLPGKPPPPPPSMSRPASRFAAAPPKSSQSIFGDGAISEQSLDEVILSYLAEDLEGGSE